MYNNFYSSLSYLSFLIIIARSKVSFKHSIALVENKETIQPKVTEAMHTAMSYIKIAKYVRTAVKVPKCHVTISAL